MNVTTKQKKMAKKADKRPHQFAAHNGSRAHCGFSSIHAASVPPVDDERCMVFLCEPATLPVAGSRRFVMGKPPPRTRRMDGTENRTGQNSREENRGWLLWNHASSIARRCVFCVSLSAQSIQWTKSLRHNSIKSRGGGQSRSSNSERFANAAHSAASVCAYCRPWDNPYRSGWPASDRSMR